MKNTQQFLDINTFITTLQSKASRTTTASNIW